MEYFTGTSNIKEGTDGQKLQKIYTDCDMGIWKMLSLISFACVF